MLNIIFRLLLDVRIPPRGTKDDESFRASIGLSDEADSKYVAKMIGVFLRLRAPTGAQTWAVSNPSLTQAELALFSVDKPESEKVFKRMSELKLKLVTLLASGAFTDEEKLLPALYAASSFDGRVASAAEEIVKRTSVSMEDSPLVKRLFQAHSVLPAAYRTRILTMLTKSAVSTTMSDDIMAVVTLDFLPQEPGNTATNALQPSSALERTKLHKALFQYLSWVAQIGRTNERFTIGPQLIANMKSYIESQSWPAPQQTSNDDISLRSKAYETIGMLAGGAELPLNDRLDLAAWLFRSLSEDPTSEAVVNMDGALSSLTSAIPPNIGGNEAMLKTMLLTYMYLPDEAPAIRSTRHAVVKWANQCLPFSDICGRWIDILAIGGQSGERNDVIEQGHKGLDPWTYFANSETSPSMPDWKEMTVTFFGSLITPDSITASESVKDLASSHQKVVFQNFQGPKLHAFPVALRYCKQILFLSALDGFKLEPDWMQILDAKVRTDITSREKIRAYLHTVESGYVVFFLKACLEGAFLEDSPIKEECLRCFVDVASLSPAGTVGYLANTSSDLLGLIKSNNKDIRALAAKAFGILAPHPANSQESFMELANTMSRLVEKSPNLAGPELNAAEGSLLALGHLFSRAVFYDRPYTISAFPLDLLVADGIPPSLYDAALECYTQLWSAKLAMPLPDGDVPITKVVKSLSAKAKAGNEKAITALGRLAVCLEETSDGNPENESDGWSGGVLGSILTELFALHELKRVEIHFAVGDAITAAIARWDSNSVRLTLDVESRNTEFQTSARTSVVEAVLGKLLKDCKATKPSLLKASGIWLFCIVQYCSQLEAVQARLRETQAGFMRLLSARDELVQETASRGLSLVYERGDADLKSALTKDLVSAFTGTTTQLKVDDETELFEPGALPTGEGNSITSYKDIVSLANEVGDQRLVYKFMSLAANAATWTTRSAFGRFGLSNILSESEVDPKLYPKLFRYRFDPNTNVQRSMEEIWKALVKDPVAVVDTHFDAIVEDLLKSILGREWRMRQASCAALSDLLQGRPFPQYEKYYQEIWTAALKVLDDVKGSVRGAALGLCKTLSNSLVRQLEEGGNASAAKAMMKEALPFLLSDKGVESSVQDVQIFATITVIKITKKGGESLKPFIPDMVSQLLGLLSAIEPQQINYSYQRAGEESRDQIDKLRSQMVNQSPISEAIENCLRFIDADVMTELAPRLERTIKTAIGMPTKIGCSRVLTTLFTRQTNDIQPVSARLLQLMEKQTLDRNDEVSQAYARAAAYILRAVPDAAKKKFCERFVDMYLQAEDESRRQKISDVIVAVAKISPDHFSAQELVLLPFSYLGSHDSDEYTSKVFKEVWDQHAGSKRTVVRYVPEIVKLIDRCLDTTQWGLRHTGAYTVAAMVSDVASASDATGEIGEANLKAIWPALDKTLALKTFSGKEKLLESFPEFVEKGQSLWKGDSQIAAQMKKIALREAKRNNDEYRVHAFRFLWRFAKARDDLDMLQEIAAIVIPHLDELKDEDKMEVDSKDIKDSKEDLIGKTAKNGLEAIARGYNRPKMSTDGSTGLGEAIKLLQPYLSSVKFMPIKREIWYECVKDMMTDATSPDSGDVDMTATSDDMTCAAYLNTLDLDVAEAGTESQRLKRAAAAAAILRAKKNGVFGTSSQGLDGMEETIRSALREERGLEVQKAWRGVLEHF